MITIEKNIPIQNGLALVDKMNAWFSSIMRKLFVCIFILNKDRNETKRRFLASFALSGRHFNSLLNQLDGLVEGVLERNTLRQAELQEAIKATKQTITKKEKKLKKCCQLIRRIYTYQAQVQKWRANISKGGKKKRPRMPKPLRGLNLQALRAERKQLLFVIHQKKRRQSLLEARLIQIEKDKNKVSVCFGSKKLFLKQFHLKENGYHSHAEWLDDWRKARSSSSFWLGSHEETAHNRNAQYNPASHSLKLRLPDALVEESKDPRAKHVHLKGIDFSYGRQDLEKAWDHTEKKRIKAGKAKGEMKEYRLPISYRLLSRTKKSGFTKYYVQAIFEPCRPAIVSRLEIGALGVDLNADHIAVAEVDRFGNPIHSFSYPFESKGKSSKQMAAILGDHIADLVAYAQRTGKPIVSEDLDFARKKAGLREKGGPRYALMLSSFCYQKFHALLAGRCAKVGVALQRVNPAYTSVIGYYCYRNCKKFSTHELAAVAIARRGLGKKERIKSHGGTLARTDGILGPMRIAEPAARHALAHGVRSLLRFAKIC